MRRLGVNWCQCSESCCGLIGKIVPFRSRISQLTFLIETMNRSGQVQFSNLPNLGGKSEREVL